LTTKKKWPKLKKLLKSLGADELGCNYFKGNRCRTENLAIDGDGPFHTAADLHMAMGSSLQPGQVLVRSWWD